jgi:putative alpha-1,2-mannosidase
MGPVFGTSNYGLPGNDDGGSTIALVTFLIKGSLGAYIVWIMTGLVPIAGQSVYLILPPAFPEVQWTVTNSRTIVRNRAPDNIYIQSVTVDGIPVTPIANLSKR